MNFNTQVLFWNTKSSKGLSSISSKETIQRQYNIKLMENDMYIQHKLHYDLLNYIAYINYFIQLLIIKQKNNPSIISNSTRNLIALTNEAENIYFHLKEFVMPIN